MKMAALSLALVLGVLSTKSLGSVPATGPSSNLEKILSSSSDEKFGQLKKLGPQVYGSLRHIAFDQNRALGIRWQAFMAMARLGDREALPEVEMASRSSDWFLRDAALKVLPLIDHNKAYKAALQKLSDSALVVRTTAVDTLAELKCTTCVDLLWSNLYSRDNYIKKQSLWIRRHIVEALAELAPHGNEARFIKVLDDSDATLVPPAVKALERLTHQKLALDNASPAEQKVFWKKWYQESVAQNQISFKRSPAALKR